MMQRDACLVAVLCLTVGCSGDDSDAADSGADESLGLETLSGTDSAGSGSSTEDSSDPTTGISATDGDSSSEGGINCGVSEYVLEAVPPNVVLVLDKSGSMIQNTWDADADPETAEETRWKSLHDVVSFVVDTFDDEINFGAALFPSVAAMPELGAAACVVNEQPEVEVQSTNATNVLNGIPGANAMNLEGATPATAGIVTALDHLKTLDTTVDRFIVLITDGAANCGSDADTSQCPGLGCGLMEDYDQNLPVVVGDAFTIDEVPTFVIGIDIRDELVGGEPNDGQVAANTFEELNTVAEAGGRARDGAEKFFNAENEIELQEALAQIAGQVVSCTIPLDPVPMAPNFVEIMVGGTEFDRVEDCENEDGWAYVNPEGPFDAIELCNAACDALAESGDLDAIYGCPPSG